MTEKLLYSIPETGRALGVARSTIYTLIAVGRLQVVKIGRRTLVRAASIRELAGERPADAA